VPTQDGSEPDHTATHTLERLGAVADLVADAERASADLVVTPALHQPYGIVHGGAYAALAERVAEAAGQVWLGDRGRARATVVGTQFLRAVREGRVHAVATPVHRGRGQQLWQVRMTDDAPDGRERVVAVSEVRLLNVPH
jgi:1,4-dihydroxy-2-naphthoyl-CoA hydrolase